MSTPYRDVSVTKDDEPVPDLSVKPVGWSNVRLFAVLVAASALGEARRAQTVRSSS